MVREKISTNEQFLAKLVELQQPFSKQLENLSILSKRIGALIEKRLKEDVTLYYGGSKERDTLLRDRPDLNIGILWPEDSDNTLEEIHAKVGKALRKKWGKPTPKNIGWEVPYKENFKFSVIPGKFINNKNQGAIFYFSSVEELVETSLKIQDDYIRESDRGNIIRLMKLWIVRRQVPLNSCIIELICINACKGINRNQIERQADRIFDFIYDNIEKIKIYDPANEENLISDIVRRNSI